MVVIIVEFGIKIVYHVYICTNVHTYIHAYTQLYLCFINYQCIGCYFYCKSRLKQLYIISVLIYVCVSLHCNDYIYIYGIV